MIYRNSELTRRVHDIQSQLAIRLEVAYRMTRRLEDYQVVMLKYQARQALVHFPKSRDRDEWKYNTETLASSQEFIETVYSLSGMYGGYHYFLNLIAEDLKAFLNDLNELG